MPTRCCWPPDMEVVKRICHRAALLANGRIIESGTVADLVRRGDSAIARELAPRVPSLAAERAAGSGSTIVDVRFVGDIVERPVLADLVRRFDLDVNVIGGGVDVVAGVRLGRLQLELPGRGHEPVLAHLRDLGLQPEVIA
jgi:D-methionine transport system ATP-binding protein